MAAVLGGCAQQPDAPLYQVAQPGYGAGALCFDPPVSRDQLPPDVAREGREPEVVLGYQQQSTSYVDTFTYDRQSPNNNLYYRESYLENTSTLSR
jgi:hypothetical protein